MDQGDRFIMRYRGDRHLIPGRQRKGTRERTDSCPSRYRTQFRIAKAEGSNSQLDQTIHGDVKGGGDAFHGFD